MQVEIDDGPPVPPPVRRRRRRRRIVLALAAVLVLAVPIGLAVAGGLEEDPSAADAPDPSTDDEDARGDADEPDAPDGELVPPELDALSGVDEHFARLLVDVDAAERVMMGFQDDLLAELERPDAVPEAGDLLARLRGLAEERRDELLVVRERLLGPGDESAVDAVRAAYLEHLDAWAAYLDAVAEDPLVVLGQGGRTLHSLAINTTADAFARRLTARLPDDVDPSVRRFAEGILDRGFRGRAEATV